MKSMLKPAVILLLLLAVLTACSDNDADKEPDYEPKEVLHLQYIGLKEKTDTRAAQLKAWDEFGVGYDPSMQLRDNYLYVTTYTGIYRKSLTAAPADAWEQYAFKDIPVRQFVQNGNSILAATAYRDERTLLLSDDGGQTYRPVTPPEFVPGPDNPVIAYSLAQNPKNPRSLLAIIYPYGVAKSTDFGQTWKVLSTHIGGYQNWFVGFHPKDTTQMYNTGESMIYEAFINASYDDGKTWELIERQNNNCIHHIAFHPTEPKTMIYSGEYIIRKSTDQGRNWDHKMGDHIYFFKTLYDETDPSVVYTSGITRIPAEFHKFAIHRSTDGGEHWSVFFQTDLPGEGGVIDLALHQKKLYLYTFADGIYEINTAVP